MPHSSSSSILRHHQRRRTLRDDRSVAQNDDAIALPEFVGLVLDDDEAGALLAHFPNQRENFRAALGIEVGSRLVEDDHARPQRQHRRDREALLLPARERSGIAILEAAQPDRFQRRGEPREDLFARHPDPLHRECNLMRNSRGKELRFEILEDHPDFAGEIAYA